jgi:hypothetical protein
MDDGGEDIRRFSGGSGGVQEGDILASSFGPLNRKGSIKGLEVYLSSRPALVGLLRLWQSLLTCGKLGVWKNLFSLSMNPIVAVSQLASVQDVVCL